MRRRGLIMSGMICDVCGYEDTSKLKIVVVLDIDGMRRCKKCRDLIRYGRYIHDDDEAFELDRNRQFTDEWKEVLRDNLLL
jgi:hypothetical protein